MKTPVFSSIEREPPDGGSALILTGHDPKLIKKREQKERKLQLELNKKARELAKETEKQRERQRREKPITVLTVNHNPTYSVIQYRRLNGKENRKPPSAFISKNEIQSVKSQTRLKNGINWMLLFADKKRVYSKADKKSYYFRLAFITLTLSGEQTHSDDFIKEHMLQPFLYWLSRYYGALYVWKAESQLNGRIHFHITIDTYVPWKSIRAKWNKSLAKYGYCKVFQDGTNDKGNAATQIKSVLSERKCAADIGGYMSKKDEVSKEDQKACENRREGYQDAQVHCKWDPVLKPGEQDKTWYKRVIDGRLWGCSENLSKIKIFIDETWSEFQKEEQIFFRQNNDIYNLGKKVIEREKQKYSKVNIAERQVRNLTDEDIEKRYRFMENVFIHPHLSVMKKGGVLQKMIHEEKMKRKKNFQNFFTEN